MSKLAKLIKKIESLQKSIQAYKAAAAEYKSYSFAKHYEKLTKEKQATIREMSTKEKSHYEKLTYRQNVGKALQTIDTMTSPHSRQALSKLLHEAEHEENILTEKVRTGRVKDTNKYAGLPKLATTLQEIRQDLETLRLIETQESPILAQNDELLSPSGIQGARVASPSEPDASASLALRSATTSPEEPSILDPQSPLTDVSQSGRQSATATPEDEKTRGAATPQSDLLVESHSQSGLVSASSSSNNFHTKVKGAHDRRLNAMEYKKNGHKNSSSSKKHSFFGGISLSLSSGFFGSTSSVSVSKTKEQQIAAEARKRERLEARKERLRAMEEVFQAEDAKLASMSNTRKLITKITAIQIETNSEMSEVERRSVEILNKLLPLTDEIFRLINIKSGRILQDRAPATQDDINELVELYQTTIKQYHENGYLPTAADAGTGFGEVVNRHNFPVKLDNRVCLSEKFPISTEVRANVTFIYQMLVESTELQKDPGKAIEALPQTTQTETAEPEEDNITTQTRILTEEMQSEDQTVAREALRALMYLQQHGRLPTKAATDATRSSVSIMVGSSSTPGQGTFQQQRVVAPAAAPTQAYDSDLDNERFVA